MRTPEGAAPVFVALDIGCIECGVKSEVLGIYEDKTEAERVRAEAEAEWNQRSDFDTSHEFVVLISKAGA